MRVKVYTSLIIGRGENCIHCIFYELVTVWVRKGEKWDSNHISNIYKRAHNPRTQGA